MALPSVAVSLAAFRSLCLDAVRVEHVSRFWAEVLGAPARRLADGAAVIRSRPLGAIRINPVPEPKVLKNRVHLDVYGGPVDLLVGAGARVLADQGRWQVLADPEGNELCLFAPPEDGPEVTLPVRPFALCVDSAEPEALAAWWAAVLGGTVGPGPDGTPRWLHGATGLGDVVMKCVRVSDVRSVKNRCHWDVGADDVAPLLDAGARLVRAPDDGISWTVLTDPQGNEFCIHPGR